MAQSVRYGEDHQLRLCEVKENINVILLSSDLISFLFVFLFFVFLGPFSIGQERFTAQS